MDKTIVAESGDEIDLVNTAIYKDTGKYESTSSLEVASCARVDAKTQDRDVQMKYDIAKNDDGPLRKTVKNQGDSADMQSDARRPEEKPVNDDVTANRYPAIDERLRDIETHVAVRYGTNERIYSVPSLTQIQFSTISPLFTP